VIVVWGVVVWVVPFVAFGDVRAPVLPVRLPSPVGVIAPLARALGLRTV
jgi:hypothetical protein